MPISPENRRLYPDDWADIRSRILKRACNACECTGHCGTRHEGFGPDSRCGAPHNERIIRTEGMLQAWRHEEPARRLRPGERLVRVTLTIAHRDHDPRNSDKRNLLAMCQLCHNRMDLEHRQANARRTRRRKRRQLELTEGDDA